MDSSFFRPIKAAIAFSSQDNEIDFTESVFIIHQQTPFVKLFLIIGFYCNITNAKNDIHTTNLILEQNRFLNPGRSDGGCYCSNNLILRDEDGPFLLAQYSDVYDGWARVGVMHFRVRILR